MPHRRTLIDATRGLCLVNIFINHIEGGVLTHLSPSRLTLFDCSDVFVLLSGASASLAYGGRRADRLTRALWRRACQLYAFNVGIMLATIGLFAAILAWRGPVGVHADETLLIDAHGAGTVLWHALTLRQTVGYSAVLRLYLALMLMAPPLLILARWRWWTPLVPAGLLWVVAGHFRLVVPNSLSGEPFLLTILPWVFLFGIGIALGQASTRGIRLPRSRPVLVAAFTLLAGYLILSVIVVRFWPPAHEWALRRNDVFWLGASKTYQSPLRLLHLLAFVYIVLVLPRAPVIRLLHEIQPDHLACRIGRHSLLVFSLGAVAAVAASEILDLARTALSAGPPPLPAVALLLELALIALYLRLALWLTTLWPTLGRTGRGRRVGQDSRAWNRHGVAPSA